MEWVGTYTDSVEGPFYREVAHFVSGTPPGHQLPGRRHERYFKRDGWLQREASRALSMSLPAARDGYFLAFKVLKWGGGNNKEREALPNTLHP